MDEVLDDVDTEEQIDDSLVIATKQVDDTALSGASLTNSKGKEISDDIEKDINNDVHINSNTSCSISHTSNITMVYNNNNDHLRRTNAKNQT